MQIAREANSKDILIKKMDVGAVEDTEIADSIAIATQIANDNLETAKLELEKTKEANRVSEKSRELDIKEKEVAVKKLAANKPNNPKTK